MEHGNRAGSHRQYMGLLLALTALMAGPLAMPATATAATPSAESGITTTSTVPSAETASDTALRTSSTMIGVVLGTVALVGLWWYLIVRNLRRK